MRSRSDADAIKLAKWRLTLQPGDLCCLTFYHSSYLHLGRLRQPKAKENMDRSLWDASAFCGVGQKYYARAEYVDSERSGGTWERCKRCWQKYRSKGEPMIATPSEPEVKQTGIWLAFGWHEVPAVGIPEFDLGKDGDPETTADDTGKIWGEKRTETQRWQRGTRYVRIVELFDSEYKFAVRYGVIGEPKTDKWTLKANLKQCLDKASRLMAIGGMAKND
jgi:hypothetical protein